MTPIFRTELMPMAKISVGGTNMSKKSASKHDLANFQFKKLKCKLQHSVRKIKNSSHECKSVNVLLTKYMYM